MMYLLLKKLNCYLKEENYYFAIFDKRVMYFQEKQEKY